MATEAEFLQAIRARPNDSTVRLVYADWLDECGTALAQVRAETVRVEEEMRALPVFAERFWELKLRREQLIARRDTGWFAALGCARDSFRPCVGHGWRERFRLARAFIEVWLGRWMPDVGGERRGVEVIEAEWGFSLAPAVREWVALAADAHDAAPDNNRAWRYSHLCRIDRLPEFDGYTALYDSGTDYYMWQCVRAADAHLPDPPVVAVFPPDDDSPEGARWQVNPPSENRDRRLSAVVLESTIEAFLSGAHFWGHVPDADADRFFSRFRAECLAHGRFQNRDLYEANELIAFVERATYPGPGWSVDAVARRASRATRASVPPVLWELVLARAAQEERERLNVNPTTGRDFLAAFARAGPRPTRARIVPSAE
jgi:uncharacterized protein (TIGR02996 family)